MRACSSRLAGRIPVHKPSFSASRPPLILPLALGIVRRGSLRPRVPCAVNAVSDFNPVKVAERENQLQSNKLPDDVRQRVEGAVEKLRFRVTVGEVAASAGVKVSQAEDALKALAYDSLATLEVILIHACSMCLSSHLLHLWCCTCLLAFWFVCLQGGSC